MSRWKLTVEYDGAPFVGWQRQENRLSVQEALEEAVLAFSGERAGVHGAGRTDAGVHALGQVAHLDLARDWSAETVRDALNAHLRPLPVSILAAEPVEDGFHARFSARERRYLYRIINRRAPLAIERGHAWWVPAPLDAEAMARAGAVLVGRHDFTSFRAAACQAENPVKTMDSLVVSREGEEIRLRLSARSFLHNQVRIIAGTLVRAGEGRLDAEDMASILAARDRAKAGATAPPDGLYLTAVGY